MRDILNLNIDRADGSLQRLIGLVERRGFHIDGLNVTEAGTERRVELMVRGRDASRCLETLGRQIDRLYGVRRAPAGFSPEAVV